MKEQFTEYELVLAYGKCDSVELNEQLAKFQEELHDIEQHRDQLNLRIKVLSTLITERKS
jgi:hypothetical protein